MHAGKTALLLVLAFSACRQTAPHPHKEAPEPDPSTDTDVEEPTDTLPATSEQPVLMALTDLGASSALQDYDHSFFRRGRACVPADFDGDGKLDMYLGNPGTASFILYNRTEEGGPLLFVPSETPLGTSELFWGASAGDFDNDGDPDLAIAGGGNEGAEFDVLWQNQRNPDGTHTMIDITARAGMAAPFIDGVAPVPTPTGGVQWVDWNNDGFLDLYANGNIKPHSLTGTLAEDDPMGRSGLWENNGDGTFTLKSAEYGIKEQLPTRHSTWFDYDNDGDVDLFENNYRYTNTLYKNLLVETGSVSFEDATHEASADTADLHYPLLSFASATTDLNNDGWLDLVVFTRDVQTEGPHLSGHTLFLNVGGTFVDATVASGIDAYYDPGPEFKGVGTGVMGCQVGDVNADGFDDLFIGNGGPTSGHENNLYVSDGTLVDLDTSAGPVKVPHYVDWSTKIQFPAPEIVDPNLVYPDHPYRTHGICIVDLDDDGVNEVFVANGGMADDEDIVREPNRLFAFTYEPKPNSLRVHPKGDGVTVNKDGIGTRVVATVRDSVEDRTWEVRGVLVAGSAFSAQNGPDIFLGLGTADEILSLEVQWPDGHVTDADLGETTGKNARIVVQR